MEKSFSILKNIKDISNKNSEFVHLVNKLIGCIEKLKGKIVCQLSNIQETGICNLKKIIKILEKFYWIESYAKNFFKYIIEDIIDLIESQEEEQTNYYSCLDIDKLLSNFSVERGSEIEKIEKMILSYGLIIPLAKQMNDLNKKYITRLTKEKQQEDQNSAHSNIIEIFKKKSNDRLERFNDQIIYKMGLDDQALDTKFLVKIDCFLENFPLTALHIQTDNIKESLKAYLSKIIGLEKMDENLQKIIKTKDEDRENNLKLAKLINTIFIDLKLIKDKNVIIYCPTEINEEVSCDRKLKEFNDLIVDKINKDINETRLFETDSSPMLAEDLDANIMVLLEFKRFINNDELFSKLSACTDKIRGIKLKIFYEIKVLISNKLSNTAEIKNNFAKLNKQDSTEKSQIETLQNDLNTKVSSVCKEIDVAAKELKYELKISEFAIINSKYQTVLEVIKELHEYINNQTLELFNNMKNNLKKSLNELITNELEVINNLFVKFDAKAEVKLSNFSDT